MPVNTKKVQGRRQVHYESLDDLLEEAKRFSQLEVKTLGNWSVGQNLKHLAQSLDMSIDGADFSMPAPVRWIMTMLMKKKFLTQSIPAGFSTGATFTPDETSVEDGLAALEKSISRQKEEPTRVMHPGFGNISREEWNDFHLRHSELHMSFLIPPSNPED